MLNVGKTGTYTHTYLELGDVVTRVSKVEILREATRSYFIEITSGPNRGFEKIVPKKKVTLDVEE